MGRDGDTAYVVPNLYAIDRFSFRDTGNLKEDIAEWHRNPVLYYWMKRLFLEALEEHPEEGAGHPFSQGRYIELCESDLRRLAEEIRSGKILQDFYVAYCYGPYPSRYLEDYQDYPKYQQAYDLSFIAAAQYAIEEEQMAVYYISYP